MVDAVLTIIPLLYRGEPVLRMPSHVKRFAVAAEAPAEVVVHVQHGPAGLVDVVVCVLDGVRYDTLAGRASDAHPRRLAHEVVWTEDVVPAPRKAVLRAAVVLGTGPVALVQGVLDEGFAATPIASVDELEAAADGLGAGDVVLVAVQDDPVGSAWTPARAAQILTAGPAPRRHHQPGPDVVARHGHGGRRGGRPGAEGPRCRRHLGHRSLRGRAGPGGFPRAAAGRGQCRSRLLPDAVRSGGLRFPGDVEGAPGGGHGRSCLGGHDVPATLGGRAGLTGPLAAG